VSMTNSTDRVEIITSVQRRRRWTAPEKVRMVEETFEPGYDGKPGGSSALCCPKPAADVCPDDFHGCPGLVEFRKDGVPVDPGPWWAVNEGQKVRG
jgi:hypothetical protein